MLAIHIQPWLVTTHPVCAASAVLFPVFFFSLLLLLSFLSPLALAFSSSSLLRISLPLSLFLSLHLFESISVAATEEPAATVAWFPALWQKVTLSLAGKREGGREEEEQEEEEDRWSDGGRSR